MRKRITAESIEQYALASNDLTAFHFDPEAARKAGFERPIAHGMHIMGLAHSLYLSKNPTHWLKSARMTFLSPLLADTIVQFDFEFIMESNMEEIEVTVTGEDGQVIARGCFCAERGPVNE